MNVDKKHVDKAKAMTDKALTWIASSAHRTARLGVTGFIKMTAETMLKEYGWTESKKQWLHPNGRDHYSRGLALLICYRLSDVPQSEEVSEPQVEKTEEADSL